jgi:acetoacetate decarboxylase
VRVHGAGAGLVTAVDGDVVPPQLPRATQATAVPAFAPLYAAGTESVDLRWMTLTYRTHPHVVEQVLPVPLRPGTVAEVAVWIAEFIGAAFTGADGTVETRPNYMQGGVCVRCSYDDEPGAYPLVTFVEGLNYGILGRELLGLPKKQASRVYLDVEGDALRAGFVTAGGLELLRANATLGGDPVDADPIPEWFAHHYPLKLIPRADGRGYDVNQLIRVPFRSSRGRGVRCGDAHLEITPSRSDPLHLLECASTPSLRYGFVQLDIDFGEYLDRVDEFPTFGIPGW